MGNVRAWITWWGSKGGKQSTKRPLEVMNMADGTSRVRFGIGDIPVRASWAEVEFEFGLDMPLFDAVGNPILDNTPATRRIG